MDDNADDNASEGHQEYETRGVVQAMHSGPTPSTTDDAQDLERIANSIRARTAASSSNITAVVHEDSDYDIPLWEIGVPVGGVLHGANAILTMNLAGGKGTYLCAAATALPCL